MAHFKISILFVFLSYFNTSAISQNVRVIFSNKTGKTIDSLVANGVFIGQIKPDSLSKVVNYEYLSIDSSGDEMRGKALLDKKQVRSWPDFFFCGSGIYEIIRQGDILYEIKSQEIDSQEYILFYLKE